MSRRFAKNNLGFFKCFFGQFAKKSSVKHTIRFTVLSLSNLSYILYRKFPICFALRVLANLSNNLSCIILHIENFLYILHQCFRLF